MTQEIKEYENWMKVNGKSKNTIRSYLPKVNDFVSKVKDINKKSIQDYMLKLQDNKSNQNINCYRKAIASYIDFKDLDVVLPKALPEDETIPDAIDLNTFEEEIIPIVGLSFDKPEKVKAIFYTLFYTGLRPSEIESLKREDLNFKKGIGRVYRPKVKSWHVFPLHKKIIHYMQRYFLTEPEEKNAFNISSSGIQKMTQKINGDFPNINLRPYLFRHSMATQLLNKNFNIKKIKKLMGHKSINSTMRYLSLDNDKLMDEYFENFE